MSQEKKPAAKPKKISVAPAVEEPKQAPSAEPEAKPAARIPKDAVVGNGATDPVLYSKARMPGRTENKKSLTVLHVQRALTALGFYEAQSAPGGRYETLTARAVSQYQESRAEEPTGVLTRAQFSELFMNDPNVEVVQDTISDH